MYLLIAAFKVFLKVCLSCFSILITMSPNRFSFEFILKDKLETKWTSWIRKSLPLSEILDNYLLIFFWLQLFLLTFWNSNYIYIWTFCPTATKLWSFLKYPFFLFLNSILSMLYVQVQWLFCHMQTTCNLRQYFFSYIVFSILKSDLFLYFTSPLWILNFFFQYPFLYTSLRKFW